MTLTIRTTGVEDYLDPQGGNAWVQAIIIGGHGVGKTPFAATWPKPIYAMCEHGTMSIARNRVPYAEIHNDRDMDAFVTEIRKDCARPLDKRQFMTVVIDTIDSYQKRLMQARVKDQNLERFTGWDNWDWLDAKLVRVLNALSQLPVHLVVNVHYKDNIVGEGDDKSIIKELRLKGDQKVSIFQEFDLIGFMETYYATEAGERVRRRHIRWWPVPGYEMVRDRSNTLPEFTEVQFTPDDFQVIFDSLASGADDLVDSEVVMELPVEGDDAAADLPAPHQGAGPVAEPKLPPAKAQPAKKRATIKEILAYVGEDRERAQRGLEAELAYPEDERRASLISSLEKIIGADEVPESPEPAAAVPADAAEAPQADGPPSSPAEPVSEPEPETQSEIAGQGTAEMVEPEPEPEPVVEEPPATKPAVQNGVGTAEEPVEIPESRVNQLDAPKFAALQHVHDPAGKCLLNRLGPKCGEAAPEPTPEPAPVAAAAPAQPAAPAASGQATCGDQPASFAGKFDAKPGCGRPLTAENKAPLAVVKHKTYLCTDCFGAAA
jgi:hypothetical protein